MPYVVLPPQLQAMFATINDRLLKVESARFTLPVVATDPTVTRKGDAWINSTTNQMKVVDSTGATRVVTWV